MFFQALIYVGIAIGSVWLIWNFVLKDIFIANEGKLKDMGIIVEEPKPVVTPLTKKLDEMVKQYERVSASKEASTETVKLAEQIAEMEKEIEAETQKMKDI